MTYLGQEDPNRLNYWSQLNTQIGLIPQSADYGIRRDADLTLNGGKASCLATAIEFRPAGAEMAPGGSLQSEGSPLKVAIEA